MATPEELHENGLGLTPGEVTRLDNMVDGAGVTLGEAKKRLGLEPGTTESAEEPEQEQVEQSQDPAIMAKLKAARAAGIDPFTYLREHQD